MPWISEKECIKKELQLTQAELKIKEQEEYINNLKTAVQLATSESLEYKKFIINTLGGSIKVKEEIEPTFDYYNPKVVRNVTQTIIIPKMQLSSKEAHDVRALIDEITRR